MLAYPLDPGLNQTIRWESRRHNFPHKFWWSDMRRANRKLCLFHVLDANGGGIALGGTPYSDICCTGSSYQCGNPLRESRKVSQCWLRRIHCRILGCLHRLPEQWRTGSYHIPLIRPEQPINFGFFRHSLCISYIQVLCWHVRRCFLHLLM